MPFRCFMLRPAKISTSVSTRRPMGRPLAASCAVKSQVDFPAQEVAAMLDR